MEVLQVELTDRRKQFLDQIIQMYSKTNKPVHYTDIADSIGVSKWTAYDVLRELEKQAFLKRSYTVNQGDTGRSKLVYVPTEKSNKLFEQNKQELSNEQDWVQIKSNIRKYINLNDHSKNPIEELLIKIKNANLRIELCAYSLCILLVHLNKQGKEIKDLTINLVNVSKTPIIQLTMFVGSVIGMIIESASERISPELVELIEQFMSTIEKLSDKELLYLIELLNEAQEY